MKTLVAPLVSGATYLRWVFLLLGGVLAAPYLGLTAALLAMILNTGAVVAGIILALVTAVVGAAVALIPAARSLEAATVRALLDVPLDGAGPARTWEDRLRTLAFFVAHLSLGVAGWLVLLAGLPTAVGLFEAPWTELRGFGGTGAELPTGWAAAWAPVTGIGILVVIPYVGAGLGAVLARLAPPLLGPSAAELLAEAERRAARLAERNRLARELHDSVGHALSVVTLQAGAARRVLDRDPEFVRLALTAIEDSGRAALEDLDHVLGLLRDEKRSTAPQPTLADLDGLLTTMDVEAEIGSVEGVPHAVSREAYRIVQESLTNARKHGTGSATLRVTVSDDQLELEVTNPMTGTRAGSGGGRGMAGMRERVGVLRGVMTAGPADGTWRVDVRLPLRAAS